MDLYSEDIARDFLQDVDATLAEDRSVAPCEANAVFKSANDDYIDKLLGKNLNKNTVRITCTWV